MTERPASDAADKADGARSGTPDIPGLLRMNRILWAWAALATAVAALLGSALLRGSGHGPRDGLGTVAPPDGFTSRSEVEWGDVRFRPSLETANSLVLERDSLGSGPRLTLPAHALGAAFACELRRFPRAGTRAISIQLVRDGQVLNRLPWRPMIDGGGVTVLVRGTSSTLATGRYAIEAESEHGLLRWPFQIASPR